MAKVTIVGAGQSGLQLGIGLVQAGHDVSVVSDRTPEDVRNGKVMSSQFMFASALDTERELGIEFWADTCPETEGMQVAIPHPEIRGEKALYFEARLSRPGKSVDQRVKYPRWIEYFASIGGKVVIQEATVADLERYAVEADLVVVAAGKGEAVTLWTNALLMPPPPHVLQLLGAASQDPRVAYRFANGFDDPRDYFAWFMDPGKADAYLAQLAATPS